MAATRSSWTPAASCPASPGRSTSRQTLAVEAYLEGGVRCVEVGTMLADRDPATREDRYPALELLRLAVPRRTYTNDHMDYVAAVLGSVYERRDRITRGYRITRGADHAAFHRRAGAGGIADSRSQLFLRASTSAATRIASLSRKARSSPEKAETVCESMSISPATSPLAGARTGTTISDFTFRLQAR